MDFNPSLQLAAEDGVADQPGHIKYVYLFILQAGGSRFLDNTQGQPFCNGRLAHAGVSYEHRVVLAATGQNLRAAFNLLLSANDWIELPRLGHLSEVVANLGKIPAGGGVFSPATSGWRPKRPRTLRMSLAELMPADPKTSRLSVGSASNPMSKCSVRSWEVPLCIAISDAWVKHILMLPWGFRLEFRLLLG